MTTIRFLPPAAKFIKKIKEWPEQEKIFMNS